MAAVGAKFIRQRIQMHRNNKQLYLVSQRIKLETSLPPDCVMECLVQTIVYLSAYIKVHNMHRMLK